MPASISRNDTTTRCVGSIGVRPTKTTKVRNADSSARPIATGANSRRIVQPRGSASVGSCDGTGVSAVVIQRKG